MTVQMTQIFRFISWLLLSCFCVNFSLFGGQMSNEYTQVICTHSKIKEGSLENVKQWLHSLENERRHEVLESFHNEGVLLECAFIREEKGVFYLVYFMRAQDVAKAMDVFRSSTLPGDAYHKQCWEQFTEQHEVLTPVFHAESEMMSNQTKSINPSNVLVDVIALSKTLCSHPIQGKLAYATQDNFLGRIVNGYSPNASNICLLTNKAARQLCLVQCALNKQGLGLFIFDAFRPLRAVRDFSLWYHHPIANAHEEQRKQLHFPHLEKTDLPRLGYAPEGVSRHCFGHAVDLSLIDLQTNQLLDMGTIFDYFDSASHHPETPSELIGEQAFQNRQLLAQTMEKFGFIAYPKEYWHFDYQEKELNEPADMVISPELTGLNVINKGQKVIGVIGGASWESTQLYYQLINQAVRDQLGGLNSAKLLIHSVNYAPIVHLEQQEQWDEVADQIADIAKTLQDGGADFIILCCNTLHKVAPSIEKAIQVPFLHIADAAARVLVDAKIEKVGLLGTCFTMEDGFYASRLGNFGLVTLTPSSQERVRMDEIIYNELCQGKIQPESKAEVITMIHALKEQGAQAILLGCTELGMLIGQPDSPIPVYDTALLHAQEAVRQSLLVD